MKRRRFPNGKFSETPMVLRRATAVYYREVSTRTTYEFCSRAYDTYCLRRDVASPDDNSRTLEAHIPPGSFGDSVLDDDWNVANLNYRTAERADKQDLLEHIRSYCEVASEARPCSVKDILEVAHRGCLASR